MIALRWWPMAIVGWRRGSHAESVILPVVVSCVWSCVVACIVCAAVVSRVLLVCARRGSALIARWARPVALVLAVVWPLTREVVSLVGYSRRRLVVVGAR
jgi:hypothetical protein